jgi:hypothetical protein
VHPCAPVPLCRCEHDLRLLMSADMLAYSRMGEGRSA